MTLTTKLKQQKLKQYRNLKRFLTWFCAAAVLTCIFIYGGFSIYYTKHFYNGTIINGLDCSKMKVSEVEELLTRAAKNYVLTLEERGDKKEQISGNDIDLMYVVDDKIKELKEKQIGILWMFTRSENKIFEYDFKLQFDEAKLDYIYDNLELFNENKVVKPKNARLSDYEDGRYRIIDAEYGNLVKRELLYDYVIDSLYQLEPLISLDEAGLYENPKITSDDETLIRLKDDLNHYLEGSITYHFGDNTEVVDHTIINKWLFVNKNSQVEIDKTKVREYVDYLGKTYNTFGMSRTFNTSYDKTIVVRGGDYGWWLNRIAETDALTQAVIDGGEVTREPIYYQKAAQYGDKDIGNTYVEINLTAQHLFYYKDGELLVESDFVSGNVSKKYGTPPGTYPIVYKERNAVLVGEDYETPVDYWLPFNGNIGMHDADWRTQFGGEIYLKNGSHGCINLPDSVAKTIYENITPGTAVVCYKLKNTDTKEITDLKKLDKEKANS